MTLSASCKQYNDERAHEIICLWTSKRSCFLQQSSPRLFSEIIDEAGSAVSCELSCDAPLRSCYTRPNILANAPTSQEIWVVLRERAECGGISEKGAQNH